MIQPADRISNVSEYYFSIKLKQIEKMRNEGADVVNLGIGSPDQAPAPEVIQALQDAAPNPGFHGYQSYIGTPGLRKAFADWYKRSYNVELDYNTEILPMMGSKEAIMHICMAFLNPGDEVLLPSLGYPTYTAVANLVSAKIRYFELKADDNWQPDLAALENSDLSKVKMMWINYPNMPTGAPAQQEVMEKIVAFCRKNNILLVNDNPYSFVLNPNPTSIMSIPGFKEIGIELNSLSKSHNMAGWRVGMAASNAEFLQYILRVKSNMDSGMFRPVQEAAIKALSMGDAWYKELNEGYTRRRELVFQIMDLLKCEYDRNQTGLFVWARIPDTFKNGTEVSDIVLEKAHVFITPGFIFGEAGERYIRISLCTTEDKFRETIKRIQNIKF